MTEQLLGNKFLDCTKKGTEVPLSEINKAKLIGIYFSAHWCPPCRAFTPVLIEFYNAVNAPGKRLEIIFASCDNDTASFNEYSSSMPWKAFPFKDPKIDELSDKYQVTGIPRLVIIKPDGTTAVSNARADVQGKGPDVIDEWLSK